MMHGAWLRVRVQGAITATELSQVTCSCLKALLEAGADVGAVDEEGNTALILACNRYEECTKLLLENGADAAAVNNKGETALLWAAYYGCLENVQLLVEPTAKAGALNAKVRSGAREGREGLRQELELEGCRELKQKEGCERG